MKKIIVISAFTLVILLIASCNESKSPVVQSSSSVEVQTTRNNYIPTTISQEAQKVLGAIYDAKAYERSFPAADDLDGWRKIHSEKEIAKKPGNDAVVAKFASKIVDETIADVPVVHIYPNNWVESKKILVYVHGGAYTMFSAHSTLNSSVPMADATGMHIISIDYTTSPFGNWEKIQNQVISVIKALLEQGYTMNDIAIYGDSAGGGLAISTVHNLRDLGLGTPAACLLLSPWADISKTGDTYYTLENSDPTLEYKHLLESSALAYADGLDLKDPRVSPIYADFSKGFSPTLITEGTKCVFLSNSVRTYQAIEAAGVEVKLDVYEGMWHVFQQSPMPETDVSLGKISKFLKEHLQ